MPTVILLDTSLSMSRPVSMADCSEEYQRRHLAVQGINTFLDYLAEHCRLEFVSLVEFSSSWRMSVPFTHDMDQVKAALARTEEELGDKTCIADALMGVSNVVAEEWGVHNIIQVMLVTDGSLGIGEGSLRHSLHQSVDTPHKLPLPFPFPAKLHVMCVAPPGDRGLQGALPLYERLVSLAGGDGEIFVPDGPLHTRTVQGMFSRAAEKYFNPFYGTLKCGNLKCNIQLFPPPDTYKKDHDFEHIEKSISRVIEICGFIDIADIGSPPYISRHLVLPTAPNADPDGPSRSDDDEEEDGKHAAFTVLLHGSLKVDSMVALTQLADDWYGIIYSWADNKKKSNLMLSVFTPGVSHIPWLGDLTHLAPVEDFPTHPYGDGESRTPFPVRPSDRRSYAQNCVVWLKQTGIQADIQKILRNARKLPEKQQHFYKELNRLRKAALAYGFHDLLDAVAQLLERECTMLPGNAHPDAALQLTHAANSLRNQQTRDNVTHNVVPLTTNFSGD